MKRKGWNLFYWLLFASLFLTFGPVGNAVAKDFIQWKGIAYGIHQPSEHGGWQPEDPLAGAMVVIAQHPTIHTTSDDSGVFVLSGIPANNMHYFKVSKAGDSSANDYITTNTGVYIGDTDIDNSMCFGPPAPPPGGGMGDCAFTERLMAFSRASLPYGLLEGIIPGAPDLTKAGMAIIRLEDQNNPIILPGDFCVSINDSGCLPPDSYIVTAPGTFLLGASPGDKTITISDIPGVTIPPIPLTVFKGEITFHRINILGNPGTITGMVTDTDNNPIEGARIEAMPEGFGKGAFAFSDSTGSYTLEVGQGSYKIQATAQGKAPQFYFMTDRRDWAGQLYVGQGQTVAAINFALYDAFYIRGTVMAAGEPLANAWVRAFSDSTQATGGAQTDLDGRYEITLRPAADYKVNVVAEGYAAQYYNGKKSNMNADLVDISTGSKENINFDLTAGKNISGAIMADGQPIMFAQVGAWSDSLNAGGTTNTDNMGQYTINLQPSSDYKVSVNTPNYPMVFYSSTNPEGVGSWEDASLVDITQTDVTNIDFILSQGKTIKGTVSAGGVGIEKIIVNASSPFGFGTTETDSSGNYTITIPSSNQGLPVEGGIEEGYRVEAFSDTYTRVMWKGGFEDKGDSTKKGINPSTTNDWNEAAIFPIGFNYEDIDFALSSGASLSGTVKDTDGKPIQGAMVNAWSDTEMAWGGTHTDSQGKFTFHVPEADGYRVNVNHPEYPMIFFQIPDADLGSCATNCGESQTTTSKWDKATIFNFRNDDRLKDASGNMVAKGMNFKLGGDAGSISGTVKAYGKPIAGVWVNAYSEDGGYGAGEPTKADGTYKLKIEPGYSYRVEVWSDKYLNQFYNGRFDWIDADLVPVPLNTDVAGIDFNLTMGNTISGVVKADSAPKKGIWVNAWSESKSSGGGAETDAKGSYTINLKPAPDYKVGVYHIEYPPQFYDRQTDWMRADPVDIASGSKTGIDFNLSSGNTISGTVLANGNPPEDEAYGGKGWVNAWSQSTGSGGGAPVSADGTYSIKVQPASDYMVQVFHQNYSIQFYDKVQAPEEATLVDVSQGNKANIDFVLSAGGIIKGRITKGEEGAANAWVNAYSDNTGFGMGESTDANGDYEIKGLAAGPGYKVSVWSQDFSNAFYKAGSGGTDNWAEATEIDLTGDKTEEGVNIDLSAGGNIEGKINVVTGAFEGLIRVDAFSESLMVGKGVPLFYGTGATSAVFSIKGLPKASDYRVQVTGDHYSNKFFLQGSIKGTSDWEKASLFNVTAGGTIDVGEVNVGSGASLKGTVFTDASKSADKVARSGWVQAMNPAAGEYMGARIGYNGAYEIKGLIDGNSYTVQATADGYTPVFYDFNSANTTSSTWVEANVVATDEGTKGIDMVVSRGHTITGKVLDSDGKGLAFAFIGIYEYSDETGDVSGSRFFGAPMTDSRGNYRTSTLPDGDYLLVATANDASGRNLGKALYEDSQGSKKVTISGADRTGLNIQYKDTQIQKRGKITGTITNSTGNVLKEVQVMVYKNDATGKLVQSKSKVNIAVEGTFDYAVDIDPGSYKVMAMGFTQEGTNPKRFYDGQDTKAAATPIVVGDGATVADINITLQ